MRTAGRSVAVCADPHKKLIGAATLIPVGRFCIGEKLQDCDSETVCKNNVNYKIEASNRNRPVNESRP